MEKYSNSKYDICGLNAEQLIKILCNEVKLTNGTLIKI